MWVKICGNTNLADAEHAIRAGADALGFVFAESRRRVTAGQVRAITARLPQSVDRYGVFVRASFDEIVTTLHDAGLNGAQLHVNHDAELPRRLRAHYTSQGTPFRLITVLPFSGDVEQQLLQQEQDGTADAILVDSSTAQAAGGTGRSFDWRMAQPHFLARAGRVPLIVAGGLHPENVAEAVTLLRPWGVDVVSGVEAAPGRKDAARVDALIQNARRASALLQPPSPSPRPPHDNAIL